MTYNVKVLHILPLLILHPSLNSGLGGAGIRSSQENIVCVVIVVVTRGMGYYYESLFLLLCWTLCGLAWNAADLS